MFFSYVQPLFDRKILNMPEIKSLSIFITAAIIMLITPGPAVLYIVARSIEQGRLAGFISALGVALGGLCHVIFAALGLSIILLQSAAAFSIVKYAGAAYLIYLGLMKVIHKQKSSFQIGLKRKKLFKLFTQGFIVNLLNPKTALFFMAFLPQFVTPQQGPIPFQVIYLGMLFITLAILSDSFYALLAGSMRKLLTNSKAVNILNRYIPASIYMTLGIAALFLKNGEP
jgi:threonine/homoserine/homoserine lactone efflux protein